MKESGDGKWGQLAAKTHTPKKGSLCLSEKRAGEGTVPDLNSGQEKRNVFDKGERREKASRRESSRSRLATEGGFLTSYSGERA